MLDSGIKPCKQQAKQKSCLTESENMSVLLDSANKVESVGNALVSTRLNASVIQNSEVRGGKKDAASVETSNGTLLIKNDRSIVVVCCPSFRKVALAKTSNDASIRSTVVDWTSPLEW